MKTLLKMQENKKGSKPEVAQLLGIDQALISKFESGTRKPTREQVVKLATLLDIDLETIMVAWLKKNSLRNRSR
jgi:transcriptional regulator with XRE-family HTH domain